MDEQRAWLRARRKGRLRIFAVILCLCVLFTTYPDILATLSALAEEKPEQTQYVSGFAELPEEIRGQIVPVGTGLEELSLPDTLEAMVTRESQSSEDGGKGPEDDGGEDTGENDGEEKDGDTSDTENDGGSTEGPEEGRPSDTEQEDTETGGGTEDKDAETGDGEDTQPEDGGESEETDESAITDNEDEADTENGEGGEGESAPSEEQQESAAAQETYTVIMPEYYAENVISVQTLENAQTKKLEETITISGITWQSEPVYDGNTEGTYTFTAVLPDGYTLADGVSLPEIVVTVENGIDAVIQVLLDRIAALPDAEEYLAAEPELEDEDAYAEWEEKLYAYAEEAFVIMQEYEALTEEQQVIVSEEALAKLTAWVEIVEQLSENTTTMADTPVVRVTADGVSTEYTKFNDAWEAAQNADSATITLLDNVKVYDTFRAYAGDDIVFEGGEYALIQGLTKRRMIMVEDGAIFTLKSGTLSGSIATLRGGTLYINGGIVESSDGSPVVNVGICVMSAGEVRGGQ